MTSELSHKVSFGDNFIDQLGPSERVAFYLHTPRNIRDIRDAIPKFAQGIEKISASLTQQYGQYDGAIRDVRKTVEDLTLSAEKGFSDLGEAIKSLEKALTYELDSIRFVLEGIQSGIQRLVELTEHPLQTQAAELVDEGRKALALGYLDDAKRNLERALKLLPTRSIVRLSCGQLALEMNRADDAEDHFKRARDYALGEDFPLRAILAGERLARVYFATGRYSLARDAALEALQCRRDNDCVSDIKIYELGVYELKCGHVDTGLDSIIRSCRRDPRIFPRAVIDRDTEEHREMVLRSLDALKASEGQAATRRLQRLTSAWKNSLETVAISDAGPQSPSSLAAGYRVDLAEDMVRARAEVAAADYQSLVIASYRARVLHEQVAPLRNLCSLLEPLERARGVTRAASEMAGRMKRDKPSDLSDDDSGPGIAIRFAVLIPGWIVIYYLFRGHGLGSILLGFGVAFVWLLIGLSAPVFVDACRQLSFRIHVGRWNRAVANSERAKAEFQRVDQAVKDAITEVEKWRDQNSRKAYGRYLNDL